MKLARFFIILLLACGTAFAARVVTLPELQSPELIRVDENKIYITEKANIYIYSKKDFKLVNKFGKKGTGPEEFRIGFANGMLWISVIPGRILVHSVGKISYFTTDGKFISEKRLAEGTFRRAFYPMGSRFVGVGTKNQEKTRCWTINIYDSNFKKLNELFSYPVPFQDGRKVNPIDFKVAEFCIYKDKIFVPDARESGTIFVFNREGKQLYSIKPLYEKIKVTEEDIQRYKYYFNTGHFKGFYDRWQPLFEFPGYFPGMRFMNVSDDKIYVLTYKKKEEKNELLILDLEGKLLKRFYLPVKDMDVQFYPPYTVSDNRFYQLLENEETEEWELHITGLDI
jgi:hypothetical protein